MRCGWLSTLSPLNDMVWPYPLQLTWLVLRLDNSWKSVFVEILHIFRNFWPRKRRLHSSLIVTETGRYLWCHLDWPRHRALLLWSTSHPHTHSPLVMSTGCFEENMIINHALSIIFIFQHSFSKIIASYLQIKFSLSMSDERWSRRNLGLECSHKYGLRIESLFHPEW